MYKTYQEIQSQYPALERALALAESRCDDARRLIDRTQPGTILFLGSGSSYCLARSLALTAQLNLGIPALALPAGDCMLHTTRYEETMDGALVVAISHSGRTSEVIEATSRLKDMANASVLCLCATEGSELAALSDMALEMPWCYDTSVCQTRAVSCLFAAGMALIAHLAGNEALLEGLKRAVAGGPAYLERIEPDLAKLAAQPWKSAVLLADAEIAGIASEGALAFQEIARKPSVHHHLLDLRHGPMVIVGPETLVIAALTDGNQYELALLGDVAKKGAKLVVYSDIPLDGLPDGALNLSFGRSLPHGARGLPLILIAQLLAYHRAVADGLDPDHPEGLEPWIRL